MKTPSKNHDAESITYPLNILGDFKQARKIAIDIGGSLVKLVYLVEEQQNPQNYHMRFVKFETKYIETCLDFIQRRYIKNGDNRTGQVISVTGGGAYKYKDLLENKLGLKLNKYDEMNCIIMGSIFLLKHIKNECYEFDKDNLPCITYKKNPTEPLYPFILVNIGSGVSFIKVDSDDKYERVGGTSLGGGTFWGLSSLLTDSPDFDDMVKLAATGNSENVDMLVQDIYGGDYNLIGLDKTLIASNFGKCVRSASDPRLANPEHFQQADMAASLLKMISYNIGQLAVLYSSLHKIETIYFGGYFVHNHILPITYLSQAVGFYSNRKYSALFFKHDGFLGALGAFDMGMRISNEQINQLEQTISPDFGTFEENLATSSISIYNVTQHDHPIKIISLDYTYNCTTQFPLLRSGGQIVFNRDLINNTVRYVKDWVPLFIDEFKQSFPNDNYVQMCSNFANMINKRLDCYQIGDPHRIANYLIDILFIQDHFVKQFLIFDPFLNYKHLENSRAIEEYKEYIDTLDSCSDPLERVNNIIKHIHAGNIHDFASSEYLRLRSETLDHKRSIEIINKAETHSIGGDIQTWVMDLKNQLYKNVVIFTDNSGYELIFGVFSLTRELLRFGCNVLLAANTYPSFNDVVSSELVLIANRIARICPLIKDALEKTLKITQTGMGSPYINFLSMNTDFCKLTENADLIIFIGSSRSLVGFSDAKFKCDTVYIANVNSEIYASKYQMKIFESFIKFNYISR